MAMSPQQQSHWLPLFLSLLLCTIALQSIIGADPSQQTLDPVTAVVPGSSSSSSSAAAGPVDSSSTAFLLSSVQKGDPLSRAVGSGDHASRPQQAQQLGQQQRQRRELLLYQDGGEVQQDKPSLFLTPRQLPRVSSRIGHDNDNDDNDGKVVDDNDITASSSRAYSLGKEAAAGQPWEIEATSSPLSEHNYALRRDVKIASTNCNSDTPQVLSPGWNGSFSSNSGDGVYPSQTRSCIWTIQAAGGAESTPTPTPTPSPSPGSSPSPSPSPSSSFALSSYFTNAVSALAMTNGKSTNNSPYIIKLTFWSPIQLVCGIDYLIVYDGPDTSSPVIAKLCGNIWMDSVPKLYSSGPEMTVVFSSQQTTPGSFGFTAGWTAVLPCNICLDSGRGTCSAGACVCSSRYTGSACQSETAGFKDFTPRSQHAMAYDPVKDMVYITGGTSFDNTYLPMDLLAYTFATNKWNKIVVNTKRPDPRYGHFSFIYNNELYIYGGMTVIGGMADVWKFNGKQWAQQPANSDHLPAGRIGAACVVITFNNVTQLVVFGGMNVAGETMRDLNIYNVDTATWKKADHKNSVGLAGATAVYHKATESVYFFGGMVNQTTRNTIPYQYFIQHDLWYALAPRIDPLTATPVTPFNGQTSSPSSDYDTDYESASPSSSDGEEGSEDGPSSMVQQYLPPVMYDPVSGVWSPAGMMGDDIVVMYGGMRPFGLGLNVKEQACYVHKMSLFDLSCQSWSSYNMTDANGVVRDRVNHTMVLRPPGAAGGSMTAWTVYIFGGFDGYEHQDMVNITLNIPARASSDINACRALRWCSLYDDCQNCNPNYCSYVNGLCLFDTDKAKTSVSATGSTSSPLFLVGAAADVPKNGTLQDLIRQRPELKTQVLTTPDNCPTRMALDLGVTHTGTIQPGEEIIFKTYIDAQDLDIRFEITTNVTGATLDFKSLNVWEGFMNMYWRADHGLTDDSWNGWSGTSSPVPADIPMSDNRNRTAGDGVVITLNGVLNVSELLNRWDKYSGLDASPSSSALFRSTNSLVDFPAGDPRRFSGYHVYSLKNTGSDASFSGALSFSLTVKLLDHPVDDEKGEKPFDLATLGFVMAGFILGVMLLILIGRKVRQLMQKREEARRTAAELRMLEEEAAAEEEEERRRRLESAAMAPGSPDPGLKDMKPLYRIILSVQPQFETTLRYRGTGKMDPMESTAAGGGAAAATKKSMTMKPKIGISNSTSHSSGLNPTLASATTAADGDDRRNSRAPLDFILDLGSSPPNSTASKRSRQSTGQGEIITSHLHQQQQQQQQKGEASSNSSSSHVQRRWSLKNLSPSASLNRLRDPFKANRPGDQEEGLVGIGCGQDTDNDAIMEEEEEEEEEARVGAGVGFGIDHTIDQDDDDQRIIELGVRSSPEQHDDEGQSRRRQNPLRVQAISIEPLVFHGALVPRTRRYYRRYQRLLARRHRHGSHGQGGAAAGTAATPVIGRSMSRRSTASERQQPPSQRSGALNKIQRTASRMTQRSRAASISSVMGQADRSHEQQQQQQQQQQHRSETIEMESLGRPTHFPQYDFSDAPTLASRKTGRMRGRQEYEPGPLVGVNVLIVFPGDAKTRPVMRVGEAEATVADSDRTIRGEGLCRVGSDGEGAEMEQVLMPQDEEQAQQQQRLPPMAIGTVFLPDPVRWWVYKARQEQDRVQFEKEMARLRRQQELFPEKSRVM